jgi:hypothetical protein
MKINKKNILVAIFYAILVCCLSACSKDDAVHGENAEIRKIRVAVLVDDDSRFRWERTAKWALQNIDEAQRGMKNKVAFELEFYNQDSETINEDMEEIAKDTSIVAVIGPTTSASATQMALKLNSKKAYRKPMITPSATRTEYQRKFADVPFVTMTKQNDTRQRSDEIFRQAGVKPKNILEIDRLVTLYSFVEQGTAASIVSDTLVQYLQLPGDDVVFYALKAPCASRELYLSYKRNRYYSKTMEAFADLIRDFVK